MSKKSELADMGITLAQIGQKIAHAVVDNGGTDDQTRMVLSNETLLTKIALVIIGVAEVSVIKILQGVKRGIIIPALTEPFVVANHFVRNFSDEATVKISYLGGNFTSWFLDQVVPTHVAGKLDSDRLTENSRDDRIMAELGAGKCETTFDVVYDLLKKQAKGEPGELLTNGYSNIFYVRDCAGVLRAVSVTWNDGGWHVYAYSVDNPYEWRGGGQVFSRNSGT
jgi:hypothetical protein